MPVKITDGPVCSDPKAVAKAWGEVPLVKERVNLLRKLVLDKTDPEKATLLPTRENMIYNSPILLELAKDMNNRGRCGADPIDTIYAMTMAFYELHPRFQEGIKGFNPKAAAYNHAWVLHKMISAIRNSVPKHSTARVS